MIDSTKRFSDRVENYLRYRPGYPGKVLHVLADEAGLTPAAIVADVGSGTGISSKLFLDYGNTVFGVEPNDEMRAAAERLLDDYLHFHSVAGTAEETTLADASVDFVVAGQAFHWFDRKKARREFVRILRPGGWVVLIWNNRCTDSTPFLQEYETLTCEFAIDYRQVDHRNVDDAVIRDFFRPSEYEFRKVDNKQLLDLSGLTGRVASSSYMPTDRHPRYESMCAAFQQLFHRHQRAGRVEIEYDTVLYFGRLN